MAASQPGNFNLQEFTDAGILLVGGRLYTYTYGTTTHRTAYTDAAGLVPHTYTLDGSGGQYIALNARGELPAPLYLDTGSYDICLKRADGTTVWTRRTDGVNNAAVAALAALAAAATGPSMMGFDATLVYAIGTIGRFLASTMKGDDGKVYKIFAFVVRNDGTGWDYIDDADHRPTNMGAIAVVGDDLRVTYGAPGVRVVTCIVGTDETMSALGMTCGPSVGLDYSNIKMYIPFACWVEKSAGAFAFGAGDGLNPWLDEGTDTTIATSVDESTFTITHKTASGSHPPVMTVLTQAGGGGAFPGVDIRMSWGGTSIIGTAHALFEGYVSYNAGTGLWEVDTPNIAKPTFGFSAGVLTVTHENLGTDTKSILITDVSGVYLSATGSTVTGTTFQVVFQDYAGLNITPANANMKFRYMRPRMVKTKAPDGMRVGIQRGPVILDPNKVESVNGNLWGIGVLEVVA
jgi:hypothetical protein